MAARNVVVDLEPENDFDNYYVVPVVVCTSFAGFAGTPDAFASAVVVRNFVVGNSRSLDWASAVQTAVLVVRVRDPPCWRSHVFGNCSVVGLRMRLALPVSVVLQRVGYNEFVLRVMWKQVGYNEPVLRVLWERGRPFY